MGDAVRAIPEIVDMKPQSAIALSIPIVVLAALSFAPTARAQDATDGQREYLVVPYLMLANMNGTTGIGTLPEASVDESASDIFSNLQAGAMLYAEARKGRWAFSSDFVYMRLGDDVPAGAVISSGDVVAKQLGWEVDVLRRISPPWLEVGGGLLLNSIESAVSLVVNTPSGPQSRGDKLTETWVDPTLVGRATFPFAEKWYAQGRVNLGGFGIGSNFSWQAQADAGYHFSPLMLASVGYRVIGIDYDHGSGEDRFVYDVTTFGPTIRFGFEF